MVGKLARISASALVPDQLLPYVSAVSGLESEPLADCVLHHGGGQGVLVAYPVHDPLDAAAAEKAVADALQIPDLERLTVIAASSPQCAPANAAQAADVYWQITLPVPKLDGKLANMLRRAERELEIVTTSGKNDWTDEHERLVADFCNRKKDRLDSGTVYLFSQIAAYLAGAPDALLFSARLKRGDSVAAFAIGDFTALETAFYMFAFRRPDAPPGAADLLVNAICREGAERGHQRLNLGLGINPGVSFFKKKWGATPFLPYIETAWEINRAKARKGWFARLFGK